EANAACYMALAKAFGVSPVQPLEVSNPGIGRALASAGFRFESDVLAFGELGCGAARCVHAAVVIEDPGEPKRIVEAFFAASNTRVDEVEPGHFTGVQDMPKGPRRFQIKFVPIDWTGVADVVDPFSPAVRRATHVFFNISGAVGDELPDP